MNKNENSPMSKKYSEELIEYAHEMKAEKKETDAEIMEELKGDFYEMCKAEGVSEGGIEKFWGEFEPELKKRPYLAKFTVDAEGCKSPFFPMWVMDVIHQRMSRSMYPAYYKGYDIKDELSEIRESDPFYVWSDKDPVFVYVRGRDKIANRLMQEPGVERILNPGAGNCPEIFELDYDKELLKKQDIRCCDIAKTGVKEKVEGMREEMPNFSYEYMDLTEFIQKEATFQPNLIVMKGTLSYQMEALPKVIGIAAKLLAPGGKLFFDLQLSHYALLRNLETFTWGEGTFGLLPSPEAAVELVKKVVTEGQLPFEIEGEDWYESFTDEDGEAVGIAFTLKKVG